MFDFYFSILSIYRDKCLNKITKLNFNLQLQTSKRNALFYCLYLYECNYEMDCVYKTLTWMLRNISGREGFAGKRYHNYVVNETYNFVCNTVDECLAKKSVEEYYYLYG